MIGGVSGSDTTGSGSKLNIPSRAPLDIWSLEFVKGYGLWGYICFFLYGEQKQMVVEWVKFVTMKEVVLMVSIDVVVVTEFQKI